MAMVKRTKYDLVVIGAGSGGYAAARTARALGATVAMVDHGPLGGLCILKGCMPSKTLLASSDRVHDIREAGELGIEAPDPKVDLEAIFARKREVIRGFADYRIESLEQFPMYEGNARFLSSTEVAVGDDIVLEATNVIIATGSIIADAVVPGLAEVGYVDSDEVLDTPVLPRSVIVLGGGYVGAELGQFLARMGVRTTFVIRAPHLLSPEDADVGEALTAAFRAEGIDVLDRALLSRVELSGGEKVVHFVRDGVEDSVAADEIFYALGRLPNVAGLALENAGVRTHLMTGVTVGPDLRTSVPSIFAVGDVNGVYPLVHVAIYQGELAARNAVLGTNDAADYTLQRTHTVFTDPQVAVVGRTAKELTRENVPFIAASYPFADHGKAIAIGKTLGFVKMLASPSDGKLLGAAVVGVEASDLIHEVVVAMWYGGTVGEFARIPHLHPTLAEIWTYPAEELAERVSPDASSAAPVPIPMPAAV